MNNISGSSNVNVNQGTGASQAVNTGPSATQKTNQIREAGQGKKPDKPWLKIVLAIIAAVGAIVAAYVAAS